MSETQASQSSTTGTSPQREMPVPEHNETLYTRVIETYPDEGKRRVERTYRRVITDASHIPYIEQGDFLVRQQGREWVEDRIVAVGPEVSCTEGMHIQLAEQGTDSERTASPHVIHLSLLQSWVDDSNAFVYGRRTQEMSELEGVDYDVADNTAHNGS